MPSRRVARTLTLAMTSVLALVAGCGEQPSGGAGETSGGATTSPDGGAGAEGGTATPGEKTVALPSYWFESDFDAWVGKRWQEIDLLQFMPTKPTGLDVGTRYVVFYSRTCEHCEEMFRDDFIANPALARQVTAVEIPAEKDQLTSPDGWAMPTTEAELMNLPLGPNWIITTPLALKFQDGVVQCAEEGDHHGCLGLPKD